MNESAVRKFDFRRSGFIDPAIARVLRGWMGKAATLFLQRWEELAPTPVRTRAEAPLTQTFGTLIDNLDEFATGCTLLVGAEKIPSVLTVSQSGMQALVSQILCDPLDQLPAPRELTSIELELTEMLLKAVVAAASEAWPQKETLLLQAGPIDPLPRKLRIFSAEESMIAMPLIIESSAGPVVLEWSLPRSGLAKLLAPVLGAAAMQGKPAPVNPLEAVLEIPVSLSVTLGTASLGMTELCELGVGDVIVLDQPISSPLQARIGNDRVCAGWAGRVGSHQALKITDCF